MPDANDAPDAGRVPLSISQLIRAHQDRTGDSLYDIERRSVSSGYTVSQKYLWRVADGQAKGWPKYPATISAIAIGLQTTPLAVLLGYGVEIGVPGLEVPRFASQVPSAIDDAPERLQDALLGMIRAVADPSTTAPPRLPPDAIPDVTGVPGMIEDDGDPGVDEPGVGGQS